MKVSECSSVVAVIVLLLNCISAKPMFGTTGMMRKKFPGTSDMSYNTYRNIAQSSNRPRQTAPTFVGPAGTRNFGQSDSFLLEDNSLTPSDSGLVLRSQGARPFNRRVSVQSRPSGDYYPSSFVPRESFASLYFPYYSPAFQTNVRHPYQPYSGGQNFW